MVDPLGFSPHRYHTVQENVKSRGLNLGIDVLRSACYQGKMSFRAYLKQRQVSTPSNEERDNYVYR